LALRFTMTGVDVPYESNPPEQQPYTRAVLDRAGTGQAEAHVTAALSPPHLPKAPVTSCHATVPPLLTRAVHNMCRKNTGRLPGNQQ
jgi:hypothetical protein